MWCMCTQSQALLAGETVADHMRLSHPRIKIWRRCAQCIKAFEKLHGYRCHLPKCKGRKDPENGEDKCSSRESAFKSKTSYRPFLTASSDMLSRCRINVISVYLCDLSFSSCKKRDSLVKIDCNGKYQRVGVIVRVLLWISAYLIDTTKINALGLKFCATVRIFMVSSGCELWYAPTMRNQREYHIFGRISATRRSETQRGLKTRTTVWTGEEVDPLIQLNKYEMSQVWNGAKVMLFISIAHNII